MFDSVPSNMPISYFDSESHNMLSANFKLCICSLFITIPVIYSSISLISDFINRLEK